MKFQKKSANFPVKDLIFDFQLFPKSFRLVPDSFISIVVPSICGSLRIRINKSVSERERREDRKGERRKKTGDRGERGKDKSDSGGRPILNSEFSNLGLALVHTLRVSYTCVIHQP
jgi:hypothetical protein